MDEKDRKPAEIEDVEIAPLSDDDLESASGGEEAEGCTCIFTFCNRTGCTYGDDDGEAPIES